MALGERLILLRHQLKAPKSKQCERCHLFYEHSLAQCPHCTGLSDRQVEDLQNDQKATGTANTLHLIKVLVGICVLFAILKLIL